MRAFLLFAVLSFGVLCVRADPVDTLIINGNFDVGLRFWKSSDAVEAGEIIEVAGGVNSPFKDSFEGSQNFVRLGDDTNDATAAPVIFQNFQAIQNGKYRFSFDFCVEDGVRADKRFGYIAKLGNAFHGYIYLDGAFKVRADGKYIVNVPLETGKWYHVDVEVDLDKRKQAGTIRNESKVLEEWKSADWSDEPKVTNISSVYFGDSHNGSSETEAPEMLVGNVALCPVSK